MTTKSWDDLQPGDFVWYKNRGATRGTMMYGYSVIQDGKQIVVPSGDDIGIADSLTTAELEAMPVGAVVKTGSEGSVVMKVRIGRGYRWSTRDGETFTDNEIASSRTTLVSKFTHLSAGDVLIVDKATSLPSGNYRVDLALPDGTTARALIIPEKFFKN